MAGVYIHIPFCKQACIYCDFYFTTQKKHIEEFTNALLIEIELRKKFITADIETIYFGGGTPSILPLENLQQILHQIKKHFNCISVREITLEANPDDISEERLLGWKKIGINRLSIGIQSFADIDLQFMHRAHNCSDAEQSILLSRKIGFDNINCDLIFGLPEMSLADFQLNAKKMLTFNPEHISAYTLTIEPRTALYKKVQLGKIIPAMDQHVREQFLWLHDFLTSNGYVHYEISNYAKPHFISQHNTSYWLIKPYIGLGPSAHSFDGKQTRFVHLSNLKHWSEALLAGILPEMDIENLSIENIWNESMMTNFRTIQGVSLEQLKQHPDWLHLEKKIITWENQNLVTIENQTMKATPLGWIVSDAILTDLFV